MKTLTVTPGPLRLADPAEWDHPATAELHQGDHFCCLTAVVAMDGVTDSFGREQYTEDPNSIARLNRIMAAFNTWDAAGKVLQEVDDLLGEIISAPIPVSKVEVNATLSRVRALILQRAGNFLTPVSK